MRAPHSSSPAAFPPEPPHQECIVQGKVSQSQTLRNWKKRLLLQPPELGDDSDLSSSSGSIVPYVHPTEGKTHLSIKDTEDYLTVQNPNPHTGEMSPAFSSVVMEHPEPVTLRGAKDANQGGPQRFEGRSLENEQRPPDRWPEFWRPLRKISTLTRKPPAPCVEDEIEEPPDGLSDMSPVQAQPCPTHFAAFDPDHLRIPGALRVSPPPPKTTTSKGTDAIATWVKTDDRRIYELPASNAPPPEMELPSVPEHEPSSRHVRFSDDCEVRYPYYNPPSPPTHQQLPSPPLEKILMPQIPKFARIEITRKPLSQDYELDAPPVPPKHEYIPKTWNQSTQTRASVISSRSHPIEPSYKMETLAVEKTHMRLTGNGVPRLVVTTGKKADQGKEKEKAASKEQEKEKEKQSHKRKKREKGYRREKELLPSANPTEKRASAEKSEKTEPAEQPPPKHRSRSKGASTSSPTARESSATTTGSATLKAVLDRITAANGKRISNAPVQAATAPTETAKPPIAGTAVAVTSGAAKPARFVGSRPLSTTRTDKSATASTTCPKPTTAAAPEASKTSTTSPSPPVLALTITRDNVVLVGKLFVGLWGLLALFYLLGALGRALWVVLAPVRFLFGGVGWLGGCVRGAGW